MTGRQVLEVPYEGQKRRFTIASVAPKGSSGPAAVDSLARGLETLSFHDAPRIWLITWDTEVLITGSELEEEPQAVHKVHRFCG
jgi:AAA family ATPase